MEPLFKFVIETLLEFGFVFEGLLTSAFLNILLLDSKFWLLQFINYRLLEVVFLVVWIVSLLFLLIEVVRIQIRELFSILTLPRKKRRLVIRRINERLFQFYFCQLRVSFLHDFVGKVLPVAWPFWNSVSWGTF